LNKLKPVFLEQLLNITLEQIKACLVRTLLLNITLEQIKACLFRTLLLNIALE